MTTTETPEATSTEPTMTQTIEATNTADDIAFYTTTTEQLTMMNGFLLFIIIIIIFEKLMKFLERFF